MSVALTPATQAQIQTILAKTTSALKPYEVKALNDALNRTPHVEGSMASLGSAESTLAVIFPVSGLNP